MPRHRGGKSKRSKPTSKKGKGIGAPQRPVAAQSLVTSSGTRGAQEVQNVDPEDDSLDSYKQLSETMHDLFVSGLASEETVFCVVACRGQNKPIFVIKTDHVAIRAGLYGIGDVPEVMTLDDKPTEFYDEHIRSLLKLAEEKWQEILDSQERDGEGDLQIANSVVDLPDIGSSEEPEMQAGHKQ